MRRVLFVVPLLFLGCSVTRPFSLPTPAVGEDPASYPALLVTDNTGRSRCLYDARMERDTLRGLESAGASRPRVAIPMSEVRAIAEPRFSVGRTVGLISGLAAAVVAAVLMAPDPVYSIEYR